MKKLHLWKEDIVESGGEATAAVTIEAEDGSRRRLWFRVPSRFSSMLTDSCNPFVAGTVYTAMRESRDIHVHGEVSFTLLRNLEEFQAAWSSWHPGKYTAIEITADVERDLPVREKSNEAMATFSGGVDGAFTVYRHHTGTCGRLKRDVRAGVFIHGFNIPLERKDIFEAASGKARIMLGSLGIDLITVATNFRELGESFRDTHGAQIASGMMHFENDYPTALIASTEPYNDLNFPWGSNPITDRLLSSDRLEFIHDATAFTRTEKIEAIAGWAEAMKYLRVCWQEDNLDRNCCKCEKCVRTILDFRALGLGLPECFEEDVTDDRIRKLKVVNEVALGFLEEILDTARSRSISGSWVSALEKAVDRNRKSFRGWRKKVRELRNRYALKTRLKKMVSKD